LQTEVQARGEQGQLKDTQMACGLLRQMLSRQVGSYLHRWRRQTEADRHTTSTLVKQRVLKVYVHLLQTAFDRWKVGGTAKVRHLQQSQMSSHQQQARQLTNSILESKQVLLAKKQIKDCSNKRGVAKVFKRLARRQQEQALGRWRDAMNTQRDKDTASERVLHRIRVYMFR